MSNRSQAFPTQVSRAEIVIIAVRPDAVRDLLSEMQLVAFPAGQPRGPQLAISLAAGVPLKVLSARLGAPVRWARAMPSPVCRTAKGLTGLAFSRDITRSHQRKIRSLFARVGIVLDIPEKQFDAFSVTYSSSHGYHALSALAESAIKIGLDRQTAFIACRARSRRRYQLLAGREDDDRGTPERSGDSRRRSGSDHARDGQVRIPTRHPERPARRFTSYSRQRKTIQVRRA
jgi:pyrroline-5-carboxylate reductase